jgi:hypothetical protein
MTAVFRQSVHIFFRVSCSNGPTNETLSNRLCATVYSRDSIGTRLRACFA